MKEWLIYLLFANICFCGIVSVLPIADTKTREFCTQSMDDDFYSVCVDVNPACSDTEMG